MLASQAGHDKIVAALLDRGANIKAMDDLCNTALHYAVANARFSVVEQLLAHNAPVNARDKDGKTPLDWVDAYPTSRDAASKREDIRHLLQKQGAKHGISAEQNTFSVPFWSSIQQVPPEKTGNLPTLLTLRALSPEAMKTLLAKGARVDETDQSGVTPLMAAAAGGAEPRTIELLLQRGANPQVRDKAGKTALMYAAETVFDRADVIAMLSRCTSVNAQDQNGKTALIYAAKNDRRETVKQLLRSPGVDTNRRDKNGMTALHWAIFAGNTEIAKQLIARGADVRSTDILGRTPLLVAAWMGQSEIVPVLLAARASLKDRDVNGFTPLLAALENDNIAVAKVLLLAEDPDVNALDNTGKSALMYAAIMVQPDIVRLLLAKKANVNQRDFAGRSALMWMAYGPDNATGLVGIVFTDRSPNLGASSSVVESIRPDRRSNTNPAFPVSSWNVSIWNAQKRLQIISLLLSQGADVRIQDNTNETVLMAAVKHARILDMSGPDDIEGLFNSGSLGFPRGGNSSSSIRQGGSYTSKLEINTGGSPEKNYSTRNRNSIKYAMLLLKWGVDVNAQDTEGKTALMWACAYSDLTMARTLTSKGAIINASDNTGKTALIWAISNRPSLEESRDFGGFGGGGPGSLGFSGGGLGSLDAPGNGMGGLNLPNPLNNAPPLPESTGTDVIDFLLARGANVNAQDKDGNTALMWVSNRSLLRDTLVRDMLTHQAKIDLKNSRGQTALMLAAKKSLTDMVQALLEHGATVDARDEEGNTALLWAVKGIRKQAFNNGFGGGFGGGEFQDRSLGGGSSQQQSQSLNQSSNQPMGGFGIGLPSPDAQSVVAIIHLLKVKGANVDAADAVGMTSLMWAAENGYPDVVDALLEAKANLSLKDHAGLTALEHAGKWPEIKERLLHAMTSTY